MPRNPYRSPFDEDLDELLSKKSGHSDSEESQHEEEVVVVYVHQEYSFVDVNSKLDYVFKPMRQVILKVACSVNCHHF